MVARSFDGQKSLETQMAYFVLSVWLIVTSQLLIWKMNGIFRASWAKPRLILIRRVKRNSMHYIFLWKIPVKIRITFVRKVEKGYGNSALVMNIVNL